MLGLEVELALEHRRAGDGPTPPVMTRVGIPSVWESTAAKTRAALKPGGRPPSTPSASSSAARSSAVSWSRGGRVGPPLQPTASCAALKYWTSLGVMSKRATGSMPR